MFERAEELQDILREDGLRILNETSMTAVEQADDGTITTHLDGTDAPDQLQGSDLHARLLRRLPCAA